MGGTGGGMGGMGGGMGGGFFQIAPEVVQVSPRKPAKREPAADDDPFGPSPAAKPAADTPSASEHADGLRPAADSVAARSRAARADFANKAVPPKSIRTTWRARRRPDWW